MDNGTGRGISTVEGGMRRKEHVMGWSLTGEASHSPRIVLVVPAKS